MPLPDCYPLLKSYVESKLPGYLPQLPAGEELADGMRYPLLAGGKRIRPVLLLALHYSLTRRITCCTCPTLLDMEQIDPNPVHAACALEYIHTYSLVHDDLPSMDNDDLRRGRPTLHKVKGEAMAILSGDALLTAAFCLIADAYAAHPQLVAQLTHELSHAALKMVKGQVMDTIETSQKPATREYLEALVDNKTGALLTTALVMGGLTARVSTDVLGLLRELGLHLGRLFQITDDLLDVSGTSTDLGKTPGKDAEQEKLTFVTLLGEGGARAAADETLAHALEVLTQLDCDALFFNRLLTFVHERTY